MAKAERTLESVMRDLQKRDFKPIYYLMGEEGYYIDKIADFIADNVMPEEQREFNQMVVFGADVTMASIVTAAKRFPMMSEYQLIIVKEAQVMKDGLDALSIYLQNPQPSTILVFCHQHGVIDRRKKVVAQIDQLGVLFESKKLKDSQLPAFIGDYLRRRNCTIEPKAAELLAEFVGADLSRLASELDKLIITLPTGETRITADSIEKNIGVSKEFNNFELRDALVRKDVAKANRIIKYFEQNPKNNPVQVTLGTLFSFFSNLFLAYYAPSRDDRDVAAYLGLRSPWLAQSYIAAMKNYSGRKVFEIIGLIRQCDAMSKGVDNRSVSGADLLRELIFKILH